jgi:hypothetical protein
MDYKASSDIGATVHKNAPALCRSDRQHVPCAAIGGLMRRLRATRQRYRAKSQSGAPRSMKMGNIRSPLRYDGLSEPAMSHTGIAASCRMSCEDPLQAATRFVARHACLGSGMRRSAGTRKRARSRCTIAMLSSFLPRRTSLTRLGVPRIGTKSARVSPC